MLRTSELPSVLRDRPTPPCIHNDPRHETCRAQANVRTIQRENRQSFQETKRLGANIVTSVGLHEFCCELSDIPDRPKQAMLLEPAILEGFGQGTKIWEVKSWYGDKGKGIIFMLDVESTAPLPGGVGRTAPDAHV